MIYTEHLTHNYGPHTALHDLNLHVGAQEIFGLVGPNGAGKTTAMRIFATLLRPTSGTVRLGGFDLARQASAARHVIGYMPDFDGVYEDLRVDEYLYFFAAAADIKGRKADSTIGDVLELTDLTDKREAMVESLSRGMRQRLGVARVLLHDPKVLLLDEPASGLDPRARLEMRSLLSELRAMGKTVIISSHILPELAEICTGLAILERGQLLFHGSLEDLTARCRSGVVVHMRLAMHRLELPDEAELSIADAEEEVHPPQPAAMQAKRMLDADPRIVATHIADDRLEAHLADGVSDPSFLPPLLIEAGFRIHHFSEAPLTLEDAFLQLTAGEVS